MNGTFGGGGGTSSNPYLIEDVYDFCKMKDYSSSYYFKLVNDIDFNDHETYKNGITVSLVPSNPNLNGNNRTVKNMLVRSTLSNIININASNVNFENVYIMDNPNDNSYSVFSGNYNNCRFYITYINSYISYALSYSVKFTNCAITLTGKAKGVFRIPYLFESHLHFKNLSLQGEYGVSDSNAVTYPFYIYQNIKRSYITGDISVKIGYSSDYVIYPTRYSGGSVIVDLSYFAVKINKEDRATFANYVSDSKISCLNGSFIDYELAGYETKPNGSGLQALTTAECKDVDALNAVGFLCVKVD